MIGGSGTLLAVNGRNGSENHCIKTIVEKKVSILCFINERGRNGERTDRSHPENHLVIYPSCGDVEKECGTAIWMSRRRLPS